MSKKIEKKQESKQANQATKLPHVLLQRWLKNGRKSRSKPRPTYPRSHKWEEAVPLLLLHAFLTNK